jgi:predicted phage terminase large subunit-like protein
MPDQAWLRFYTTAPERTSRHRVIQSWDTATKTGERNDFSVCTTWLKADSNYYLLDCLRGRFEYPDLRAAAIALAERFKPNAILIEDTSAGTSLAQEPKQHGRFPVRPVTVEHDKQGRAYVQQGKFARGEVIFPQDAACMPDLQKAADVSSREDRRHRRQHHAKPLPSRNGATTRH